MAELIGSGELPEILTEFSSYKLVIQGCSRKTVAVLLTGIAVLIISSFLPELLK